MERVEEEEVIDRAKIIVLDPRLPAVGGMKESVTGGPAVERVHEINGVNLPRHSDHGPCAPGIGRMREFADVSQERRGSDPAFGRREGGDSLQTEPGRDGCLLCPVAAPGVRSRKSGRQ